MKIESSITVIIPAGNEEKNIERSIKSVIDWCERVVVIASGSDETARIAEKLGAKVVVKKPDPKKSIFISIQEWINDIASNATTEWIMRLDADEVVTNALREEIIEFVTPQVTNLSAYGIPRSQYFWGGFLKGGDWYYDRLIRLWKRGAAFYDSSCAVHEQLTVKGEVGYLKSRLEHYSHPTLKVYIEKINSYTSLEIENMSETRSEALRKMLYVPPYVWLRWFFYHHGYRDGWRGIVAATMRAYYEFLRFAKKAERDSQST